MNVRFEPAEKLRGELVAPPDKSISHRAAILGTMAAEPVRVHNYLDADDTNSTLEALRAVGALIDVRPDEVVVRGTGLREAREPDGGAAIDVGNSGTLMRLLPGWLAAQEGRAFTLDGDASIRRRPIDRVAEPLRLMGAGVEASGGRLPPFTVRGAHLHSISYELPVASAQVKSCILLAGLLAEGATTITEPAPSRDHTERMLTLMGAVVRRTGRHVTVSSCDELEADAIRVPGDPSSAAFPIAAATLVSRSRLTVRDVGTNWTRTGFLRILERMGGAVDGELEPPLGDDVPAGEPVSDLTIRTAGLHGTVVDADEVPLAIDELPLVALLGCFAEGETVVRGAQELRLKESDRIESVVEGLRGLGGDIEATEDGFAVRGTGGLRGGTIEARGDHRLAMVGAVAGMASDEGVEVVGMEAAGVSYPRFLDDVATIMG
jgi:3-phosphoshikimate 1-carboxyvinyltransferase